MDAGAAAYGSTAVSDIATATGANGRAPVTNAGSDSNGRTIDTACRTDGCPD